MDGQEDRKAQFRAIIADFIEERRAAKEKDRNFEPAKYQYRAWLVDAARRVQQIQAVTHVLKATHPDAKGTSLHVTPAGLPDRTEVGSHVLGDDFVEDVVGNAAALDVFKLLKIEFESRRLIDWMQAGDPDLKAALSDDETEAAALMSALASLVRREAAPSSHPLAKQVYWLVGEDPRDSSEYHLLQPMFSSSLVHAVHVEIEDARFGEANAEVRKAVRENKPHERAYREYRDLAYRKLGGTKPQNVGNLNSERRGINYLLASLPPPAWKPSGIRLLGRDSVFKSLLQFGRMRGLIEELGTFLAGYPDRNKETRAHREAIEKELAEELALFGATVRYQYEAGWTRDARCDLPRHQQLWLDAGRAALAVRIDSEHPQWQVDDESFAREYQYGEWADQVAGDFGLWLNAQLRKQDDKLLTLGETEARHFASRAIIEVAWPTPMQRRAAIGVTA